MNNTAPLLIHIGLQRTLTTWLQRHVFSRAETGFKVVGGRVEGDHKSRITEELCRSHPLTLRPAVLRTRLMPSIEAAREQGLVPVLTNERLSGAPFSGCVDSRTIADVLHEAFPEARVLIGVREQNSMFLSHYLRYIQSGGTFSPESYFWQKPQSIVVPFFKPEVFAYDYLVRYYKALFGEDRVLVQPLELFKQDNARYLQRLFGFGGLVVATDLPTRQQENINHPVSTIPLKRLLNPVIYPHGAWGRSRRGFHRLIRVIRFMDRRVPTKLEEAAQERLRQKVHALIGDEYRESNRVLAAMTGLDLAALGYQM